MYHATSNKKIHTNIITEEERYTLKIQNNANEPVQILLMGAC